MTEVVQHHPGGPRVNDVSQAEVSDPIEKWENVGARLFRAEHDDPVVLFGVIRQYRHHHVRVQGVQVARRFVQQDDDRISQLRNKTQIIRNKL